MQFISFQNSCTRMGIYLYVGLSTTCVQCSQRPEEDSGCLGSGVANCCESPHELPRIEPGAYGRSANAFNCWAVSLASNIRF